MWAVEAHSQAMVVAIVPWHPQQMRGIQAPMFPLIRGVDNRLIYAPLFVFPLIQLSPAHQRAAIPDSQR